MIALLAAFACTSQKDIVSNTDSGDVSVDDSDDTEPLADADQDGYDADDDCDDDDPSIFPGADEDCDEVDEDCDGKVDEGYDNDGDGYLDEVLCEHGDDCDDGAYPTNPGAEDIPYDGIDQDCDGADLLDADGDGVDGYNADGTVGDDCDDSDETVYPGAEDIPKDGIDQDCSGDDDLDSDDDGYDDSEFGGDDCDDGDPSVNPGATDWMNDGIDSDCDGLDGAPVELADSAMYIQPATTTVQSLTGSSLASCDLDEDGLDDLIVGSPFHGSYGGHVGVWYGDGYATWTAGMGLSTADTQITAGAGGFVGFQVRCGDVDGDGHEDLVMQTGEILYGGSYDSEFAVLIFYGNGYKLAASLGDYSADAILEHPMGVNEAARVSWAPMEMADLDGDGAHELLLAYGGARASRYSSGERLMVLPGGEYSGYEDLEDHLSVLLIGEQNREFSRLAAVEDIDGDGNADVAALASAWASNGEEFDAWFDDHDTGETDTADPRPDLNAYGRVYWMNAAPEDTGTLLVDDYTDARVDGQWEDMAFGWELIEGDFDGDGSHDILVSGIGDSADGSVESAGSVWMFSGPAADLVGTGLDPTALTDAWAVGDQDGADLGYSLTETGDVDGDGCDDFLAAAPGHYFVYDNDIGSYPEDAGTIYLVSGCLFSGEVADLEDVSLLTWAGEETRYNTGDALLSGDFDGDGETDIVFGESSWSDSYISGTTWATAGRSYIYLSSER